MLEERITKLIAIGEYALAIRLLASGALDSPRRDFADKCKIAILMMARRDEHLYDGLYFDRERHLGGQIKAAFRSAASIEERP